MAFLRRLVGGPKSGPDWAGGMTSSEYETFLAAVHAEVAQRGAVRRDDQIRLVEPGPTSRSTVVDIHRQTRREPSRLLLPVRHQ